MGYWSPREGKGNRNALLDINILSREGYSHSTQLQVTETPTASTLPGLDTRTPVSPFNGFSFFWKAY
jgi:hypothetical protein